jgi:hypothetical protein
MTARKAGKKQRPRRSHETPARQRERRIGWLNPRVSLASTGICFLFHAFGLALIFSPIGGIVDSQPIIEQDWGLHFHHLKSLEGFWQQDKMFWGYNPFFMAGYPSNTIQDLSIKLFEFLALAFSMIALSPIQWFKVLAFLSIACVPWLMHFTARNFFFDGSIKEITAPLAALTGTLYWWNSLPREMFFYGMIGYPFAAYVAILGVSLFYRLARQPVLWSSALLGWVVFALVILPLHIQSVLVFIPPAVALLVVEPHLLRRNLLALILGTAALALLVNLAWLAPAFNHRGDDAASAIVNQLPLFTSADPFTFVKDYLGLKSYWTFRPAFWEKGFRLALLVLGLWGTVKLIRSERRPLGIMFAAALMVLFVITYFGSIIVFFKSWQSLRFKVPYDLLLILPAVYLMAIRFTQRSLVSHPNVVSAIVIASCVAFLVNLIQTESRSRMNLRTGLAPELTAIVDWIQRETPVEARVLFEESGDETGFVYNGMYLSSFIPHWTGRELIGGPINLYNDRHHFAEFHSGKLFKRDIQKITDEQLRDYFRLYNIGAVVAFHPLSIQRLRSIPGLITLDQRIGAVHLMKVNQPLTWFVEGEGTVNVRFNRVEASRVRGDEIILKYHWVRGLRSEPELKIDPVKIGDDPIPFIKVIAPPTTFELRIPR